MILSIDTEKVFHKIQHSFMSETLHKIHIEGKYFNIIKPIYDKPSANIIFNSKKTESFSSKIRNKISMLLAPFSLNILPKVLARVISQEKEIKCIQNGNEKVKVSFFADDMILYIQNHKYSTQINIRNNKQTV